MKNPSLSFMLVPLILLAGCATPEMRLASGLREAGMGKRSSSCMAHEMTGQLSLGQLIKLSKLGAFREKSIRQMTMTDFLKATRAMQDPDIMRIASASAIICAIR